MFLGPRILGVVGIAMLTACTGTIGDAGSGAPSGNRPDKGGGSSGGGSMSGGTMSGGGGSMSGTGIDMPPSLDPPTTISGEQKCTAGKPGPRMLRRLTAEQLDNTVRDLFHSADAPKGDVFNDPQVLGFTGDANALLVRDLTSQQLMNFAEQVGHWAVTTLGATLSPCKDMTADCRKQFIKSFGQRAFRQPLDDAKVNRYEALFATGATFDAGLELTITAMLQSPYFLYRRELGQPDPAKQGIVNLTPYEVASNISYLISRSMPDDQLLAAAAANQLSTRAQIDAQVDRLLQDPANRRVMHTFMGEWLETKRVDSVLKEPTVFDLNDTLRADMENETAALIEDVVFTRKGTFQDLLKTDYTFVNANLAKHYGLTGVTGTDLQKVSTKRDLGILVQGSILAGHAGIRFSSPTLRGKLVRTRLLCQDLPPPPSNVNTTIMPPKDATTTRGIFQAHVDNPSCGGCHSMMDPIGFAFENYDLVGRYRTMEGSQPIDASGVIHGTKEFSFNNLKELNDYLSSNDDVRDCMVRFMSYFAYGATSWADDGCTRDSIMTEAKASNWSIKGVLTAITHAPHFTSRVQ